MPNRINYLDGVRFKRIIQAAAARLIERHDHLNAINVFPVPDGDTGSNMAGTMRSIVTATASAIEGSIDRMSKVIAESALMGARGNSGIILAQFFCGFSEGVKGLKRITPRDFANAASIAAQRARESIANPKEGTILSVITDWAQHVQINRDKYDNFHQLLSDSIEHAKKSLVETREKLACLKKADVVDAGGQGFVYLLEGILEFTERGTISKENSEAKAILGAAQELVAVEELTFAYCTECLISGQDIDRDTLRESLEALGDSLVVAGTTSLVRVHIHTDTPDVVFEIAAKFGEVGHRKQEDMLRQHRDLLGLTSQKTSIVTDSTCDLPRDILDEYGIRTVPLRLFLDDVEYVDKLDISAEEFNKRLPTSISAKTSQPTPADFQKTFAEELEHHAEVAALHVIGQYSGTAQTASMIAKNYDGRVHIYDTCTLCGGLGMVVLEAAKRAKAGMTATEIIELAKRDCENTRVFVAMETLDFAVRGGRMSKATGFIAKMLQIKPVIEFAVRNQGHVDVVAKPIGVRRSEDTVIKLLKEHSEGMTNLRFCIAHIGAPEKAQRIVKLLQEHFGAAPEYIMPASAVLGTHSGPGACAVCMLGDRPEEVADGAVNTAETA
ncbi:MAG: DegV family protein [Pseudomonadota bacterium]